MEAFRLLKTKHAATALTGEGARLFGGRWNSPGRPVIYAASTLSLAVLEILVNLEDVAFLPAYSSAQIQFPDALVRSIRLNDLPSDWMSSPASPATQSIGDNWLASETSAVLQVPSAVIPTEPNLLLNPAHPDFHKVQLESVHAFSMDPRLIDPR